MRNKQTVSKTKLKIVSQYLYKLIFIDIYFSFIKTSKQIGDKSSKMKILFISIISLSLLLKAIAVENSTDATRPRNELNEEGSAGNGFLAVFVVFGAISFATILIYVINKKLLPEKGSFELHTDHCQLENLNANPESFQYILRWSPSVVTI